MKPWKYKLHFITSEFFYYSLFTYIILFISETLRRGFVSYFFDLNMLLAIVLFSGGIMIVTNNDKLKTSKLSSAEIQNTIFLAFGAGILVYYRTQTLGKLAWVLSAITILIISLTSVVLINEKES